MTQLINEYAQALFELATEENIKSEISQALVSVDKIFTKEPEYLELLSSPAVSIKDRLDLIDKAFLGSVHEYILSFLKLLCERGHISQFHQCADEFDRLIAFSNRVATAKVTSAVALTSEEQNSLIEKLGSLCGCAVTLDMNIDETILGGMIIEVDGKRIDGSLRHRLSEIKDVIGR